MRPRVYAGAFRLELSFNDQQWTQRHLVYEYRTPWAVRSLYPSAGPTDGGTVVTVRGDGFLPIDTPHLSPGLLLPSARCLWQCTPLEDNPNKCQEGGEDHEAVMTKPTSVTPTEIVCASPARPAGAASVMFGLALNVYESVAATCSDGLYNGEEEGLDCGGPCAACQPTCFDGEQNGDEIDVDSDKGE